MFVNYFRDETRDSPLNLAVARFVLGGYLIWKTIWYNWEVVAETPFRVYGSYAFAIPPSPAILVVEQWVLIGLLLAVMVGYRLGVTTFLSAFVLAHLATVRYTLNISGGTTALFFGVYFLVLFGLYREQDELSVDGLHRDGTVSIPALRARIESPLRESYPMTALKYNLLVVSVVYLGSGFDKLVEGGLGWAAPDNLSRILLVWTTLNTHPIPLGEAMLEFPLFVGIAAAGTLVLEVGLIVAVLAGVTIVPFALGILGMQAVIGVALGPFFFDVFAFFAMFVAWDRLYVRAARRWRNGAVGIGTG